MQFRAGRILIAIMALTLLVLTLGRAAVTFWTDLLWFHEVGYTSVFWTQLWASVGLRAAAAVIGAAIVAINLWRVTRALGPVRVRRRYGNLEIAEQIPRSLVLGLIAIVAILTGWWIAGASFGGDAALAFLAAIRSVGWGVADPLFGLDVSFYAFTYPLLLAALDYLLLLVLWSGVLSAIGYVLVGTIRSKEGRIEIDLPARTHFLYVAAAIVLLFAIRYWLGRYGLLLSGNGFEGSLGYTDVHARIPARNIIALLGVATAATLIYSAVSRVWIPSVVAMAVLVLAAVIGGRAYPSLIQKFRVEPNQLGREAPFIEWNLEATRRAYGLDDLKRIAYPYTGPVQVAQGLDPSLERLPLWDPEPLETALNQVQTLFRYYTFPSIDIDRYGPAGRAMPVAIGVRELDVEGIPESARTWQTLHLNPQYLRGLGAVVVPASRTTPQGQPVLWTSNIDPVETAADAPPQLRLERPPVYFGELSQGYIVLGAEGRTVRDSVGSAPDGIRVSSFLRKLAFAWRFGDRNLLFTGAVGTDSRLVFRRQIRERVRAVAPFAVWDPDAQSTYPVISEGRIVWMLNGYTATNGFPLSRAARIGDLGVVRYLRHSLKATVDAVTGEVRVYSLDDADPLLRTFRRVFPGVVEPLAQMPAELVAHLRYPTMMLQVQADVLEEYHLPTAEAFYTGQDVWQVPRQAGATQQTRLYPPTYLMAALPGEPAVEFLLMTPFIARERQNMTAVLAARNDAPNFGELVLLELPRDHQIPGPTQVEAVMEQDPVISPQLSLWRQSGSDVNLGHLRVLPVDSSFLYVQPLFLSAAGSPIPELERVVVSDGRNVAMASTLAGAMTALQGNAAPADPPDTEDRQQPGLPTPGANWSARALELLDTAEQALRRGEWARFGAALDELRAYLRRAPSAPTPAPAQ